MEAEGIPHLPNAVLYFAAGSSDFGHDIIPALIEANATLYGHLASGYLLDIGTPDAYAQAQRDWQGR